MKKFTVVVAVLTAVLTAGIVTNANAATPNNGELPSNAEILLQEIRGFCSNNHPDKGSVEYNLCIIHQIDAAERIVRIYAEITSDDLDEEYSSILISMLVYCMENNTDEGVTDYLSTVVCFEKKFTLFKEMLEVD